MTDTSAFPPPPPPPPRPPRRLLRPTSRQGGRQWLGVARCLADYLGIPVGVLRLAFLVGTTLGGFGLIVYLVAAMLIPTADLVDPLGDRIAAGRPERLLAVIVVVGLFVFALLNNHPFDLLVVLALVVGGGYLWSSSTPDHPIKSWWQSVVRGDRSRPWPQPRPEQKAGSSDAGWMHVPPQASWRGGQAAGSGPEWVAGASRPTSSASWTASGPGWQARGQPVERPRRPSATWATLAASIGLMVVLSPFARPVTVVVAGLAVLFSGLVLGLIFRRRIGGLVFPLVLLATVLIPVTFYSRSGVPISAGVGEVRLDRSDFSSPESAAFADKGQDLAAGHLTIDLRDMDLAIPLRFRVGTGQIDILVPSDRTLILHGHVGIGQVQVPSHNGGSQGAAGGAAPGDQFVAIGGTNVDVTRTIGPETASQAITIEARVGMGAIFVHQTEPEGRASSETGAPVAPTTVAEAVK